MLFAINAPNKKTADISIGELFINSINFNDIRVLFLYDDLNELANILWTAFLISGVIARSDEDSYSMVPEYNAKLPQLVACPSERSARSGRKVINTINKTSELN